MRCFGSFLVAPLALRLTPSNGRRSQTGHASFPRQRSAGVPCFLSDSQLPALWLSPGFCWGTALPAYWGLVATWKRRCWCYLACAAGVFFLSANRKSPVQKRLGGSLVSPYSCLSLFTHSTLKWVFAVTKRILNHAKVLSLPLMWCWYSSKHFICWLFLWFQSCWAVVKMIVKDESCIFW